MSQGDPVWVRFSNRHGLSGASAEPFRAIVEIPPQTSVLVLRCLLGVGLVGFFKKNV